MNYQNAADAIRAGNIAADTAKQPMGIAYRQGEGWFVYDPVIGCPDGCAPEMLCLALGKLPFPLSEMGAEVLISVIRAYNNHFPIRVKEALARKTD